MHLSVLTMFSLLVTCGCASHPQRLPVQESVPLVSGDCIVIDFRVEAVPVRRLVIDSAGNISPPLLGKLHLAGLTLKQAEERIQREYDQRPIERPFKLVLSRCQ